MDIFLEYIVPRKKGVRETVKIIASLFGVFILLTICTVLLVTPLNGIAIPLLAAGIYGAYLIITSQNVEYEYIVTNGELDVDTIIHRRKRKRLISVHSRTFDIVAPCGDSEFVREENANFTKVIDASSGYNDGKAYFAVFSKDGMKIKLIFEPTEKMLDAFKTFVPRNVHKRADV
ncbi:MAG: hypothetical protein IKB50_00060 [Clostridia bacterium]|nr:hypothetical protein [Clostridia bacterium]